ncbi:hypothetical protein [Leminorella grimontii]|nr:hypothetical protein [Leminorella grimontii]KFC95475.1 hypothetical protein GLGR_2016 [Leminorella grimontii ATCC 33999 = DSM 5078]VFS60480.1 Uncharacterised protein [Leminorella grimontii]
MKKAMAISLFSLFMLAGCSSSPTVGNWSKEGTSAESANADRIQCEEESRASANSSYHLDVIDGGGTDEAINSLLVKEQQQVDKVGECMKAKGYSNY